MSFPTTTVGAVLKGIVAGKSVQTLERQAADGELGILKVSAVTWGEFRAYENKAMPADYDPGDCPRPMDGDILISRANTRELVGAPVMVQGNHPNLLLSDKLLKLIPDDKLIDRRFLLRALRSDEAASHFFKRAGGSSGSMTNITQSDIRSAPIPLPPLPEQRRIASILDKADALRAKRCEALAQLDRLAQAIFVEMFGDPASNPKSWERRRLDELVRSDDSINYGVIQPGDDVENGVPLIRVGDLADGQIQHEALKRIAPEIERAYQRSRLQGDEILVSCVGSIGLVALASERERGFNIARAVARIRVGELANRDFIAAHLANDAVQNYFTQELRTVSQPTLNIKQISETQMLCPPLALQHEFSVRLSAVRESRKHFVESSAMTDSLFQSVQHRAFRGEL